MKKIPTSVMGYILASLVALLLLGLPIAVWLDLSKLAETNLLRQASDLNSIISSVRSYYANNVVSRVLASPGMTKVVHNYKEFPGAIPIPATLSLELGKVISEQQRNINYRFVSDYPFKNRAPHALDEFETVALGRLRENSNQQLTQVSGSALADSIRLIAPIIMEQPCVNCHNSHPESPKTDWEVGDVRGIQEVSITQPIGGNIFAFRYLLGYFALTAAIGSLFIALQRRQTATISSMNTELEKRVADQVAEIERMSRLRRFLPPEVADLIVASGSEAQLESHRREITALFCDLRGFTGFSESSDPEDVMALLRDYHAAIGQIVIKFRGTLERFAGDGVMVIVNDPVPVDNPALQAVRMALEMRAAIGALIERWGRLGHDIGFGIGIAHGFATLGTIGFEGRFDYAAIGTVSNVASRLCDDARSGQILISPRVLVAVEDAITVEPAGKFALKGIRRPLAAYNVVTAKFAN
ncbi:MAG TPA: adenylate/guanylate cyclase domain-containing protein [Xanthobacteraceae bacterium]